MVADIIPVNGRNHIMKLLSTLSLILSLFLSFSSEAQNFPGGTGGGGGSGGGSGGGVSAGGSGVVKGTSPRRVQRSARVQGRRDVAAQSAHQKSKPSQKIERQGQ